MKLLSLLHYFSELDVLDRKKGKNTQLHSEISELISSVVGETRASCQMGNLLSGLSVCEGIKNNSACDSYKVAGHVSEFPALAKSTTF